MVDPSGEAVVDHELEMLLQGEPTFQTVPCDAEDGVGAGNDELFFASVPASSETETLAEQVEVTVESVEDEQGGDVKAAKTDVKKFM